MSKIACCQNCTHCTSKCIELGLGVCNVENTNMSVCLKDLCEGFMWNYDNENEYKLEG